MPNLRIPWKQLSIGAVIGLVSILLGVSVHAIESNSSEEGTVKITSSILNEERTLSIALPQD